jgi:hypothetical protein
MIAHDAALDMIHQRSGATHARTAPAADDAAWGAAIAAI